MTKKLRDRLVKIKAILMDVDGVLTDGGIVYSSTGIEIKSFDVKDGYGISIAKQHGMFLGIITGRTSEIVLRRANDLGITEIYQGAIDKRSSYEEFKLKYNLKDEEIAYMGDDMLDLPVLQSVGFSAAPPVLRTGTPKRDFKEVQQFSLFFIFNQ